MIQRGQEGAEHEGCKYDGEVVLGQDMGLALFPSGTRLCLLLLRRSRRSGSGLGFFFKASHVPVRTVDWGERETGTALGAWWASL